MAVLAMEKEDLIQGVVKEFQKVQDVPAIQGILLLPPSLVP